MSRQPKVLGSGSPQKRTGRHARERAVWSSQRITQIARACATQDAKARADARRLLASKYQPNAGKRHPDQISCRRADDLSGRRCPAPRTPERISSESRGPSFLSLRGDKERLADVNGATCRAYSALHFANSGIRKPEKTATRRAW